MTFYYFYNNSKLCTRTNKVIDEFILKYPQVEITKINVSKDKKTAKKFEVSEVPYCIYISLDGNQISMCGEIDNLNVLIDILVRNSFLPLS